MRVDAAKSAKAITTDAGATQIRQFDAARIADDDVLDVAFPVNQDADLTARLMREFGKLARELRGDDLRRLYAARVEFFDASQLIRFQTCGIAVYGANAEDLLKLLC